MAPIIRAATVADFPVMLGMIQELADFEKEPDAVVNSLERMEAEQDLFEGLVVEIEGEVVAMAIYYFAYYTWVGKSLYLDDLYVKADHRGKGIGSALLKKVMAVAKDTQCYRIRWQVLNWNKPAIEVYKKVGANIDNEWSNCDISDEQIRNLKL